MSGLAVAEHTGVGRPRAFESPEQLQEAIDAYFDACTSKQQPPTMAGLAMACGVSRSTLLNYANRDVRYLNAIKTARQHVENALELGLYTQKQVAGFIFSLKNNFGWKDTQEIEHKVEIVMFNPEPPVIELSPVVDVPRALSPGDAMAVTVESAEAKATPIHPVSPQDVA